MTERGTSCECSILNKTGKYRKRTVIKAETQYLTEQNTFGEWVEVHSRKLSVLPNNRPRVKPGLKLK